MPIKNDPVMPRPRTRWPAAALAVASMLLGSGAEATTALADGPLFAASDAPGNLALLLSVEFPTAISVAHLDRNYTSTQEYLGFFDTNKCYRYRGQVATTASAVANGSFESPSQGAGGYSYGTGGATWAFVGGAGLASNQSPFTSGNPNTPDGQQVAFLQNTGVAGQTLTLAAGTYTLTYRAAQRGNHQQGTQIVRASLNGTALGSFQPSGTAYEQSPSYTFTVAAGSHAIEFAGVGGGGGDYTAFIDSVVVADASAPPAPPADYFRPVGLATARQCNGDWSGNFLNWATMQVIDPFRWVLTGGYRVIDTQTTTVIEKAWGTQQGSIGNFPDSVLPAAQVAGATPFGAYAVYGAPLYMRIWGLGNKMRFALPNWWSMGNSPWLYGSAGAFDPDVGADWGQVYEVFVRAQVCDTSAGSGGLEANCTRYGTNYKPEGLIQKYASKIRYSAFAYLNDDNIQRDGGVLRARQKFVGPTKPVPGSFTVVNPAREWNPATGVFIRNPNPSDADDTNTLFGTSVQDSGVMNYLNKFGQITPGSYKTYDNVGEMYYAAIRYFKNQGNVPQWTDMSSANASQRSRMVDGFPVIAQWDDPILYSCQKNFILGIGDVNTHADKNVPGNSAGQNEPSMPPAVSADTTTNAVTATNKIGVIEGWGPNLGLAQNYGGCCSNNTPTMAGLAYDAHTRDIRPNDFQVAGQTRDPITIDTYWVDILEYLQYKPNNQFYLAAKYGGFKVPNGYDFAGHTTPLPEDWWTTNTDNLAGQRRPDNYFTGGRPDLAAAGLTAAFADIASKIKSYTTSFSTTLPQVATAGNASFSSQYDAAEWKGEIKASELQFDGNGVPQIVHKWNLSERMATQLANGGWSSNRRIATWNPQTNTSVPFRIASISAAQSLSLDTPYAAGGDSADYLDYLRGDQTHEVSSTAAGSRRAYRDRSSLVGDIVGSKAVPIGPPAFPFAEALNPGYTAFKQTWSSRPTVVYFGANDGMLHAIDGHLTAVSGGSEMFAYVPAAVFHGPGSTPHIDGLASLGNPEFLHHYFVNVSPNVFDIDMGRTPDASKQPQTGTPDWRSILIGGLGKGGRSYYAIDVTNPAGMVAGGETAVAANVLWEFSDPDLGFTFGEPMVVKTKKYGWVAILVSGYNNSDGRGWFFVVNPRTGTLLEKVSTGVGSAANDAGLAHGNAFVVNSADGTADSAYAGDLQGNLWRLDLTAPVGTAYPAPTRIGLLTDASGVGQPVTSRPVIEVHPYTKKRFVMVGTGRLLSTGDISSTQNQSFYAITDGSNATFNRAADLPSGITFPIGRSRLHANTQPVANAVAFDPLTQMGWYEDLGTGANGIGLRVTTDPTTLLGSVSFAATLPNGSVCSPTGNSNVYARDYAVGSTTLRALVNGVLTPVSYVAQAGTVTDLRYLSVAGRGRLIVGTDAGQVNKIDIMPPPSMSLRRLNWRELPVVE